jgi:hypothetical protein
LGAGRLRPFVSARAARAGEVPATGLPASSVNSVTPASIPSVSTSTSGTESKSAVTPKVNRPRYEKIAIAIRTVFAIGT